MQYSKIVLTCLIAGLLTGCATVQSVGQKTENALSGTKVKKTAHAVYAPTTPTSIMLTTQPSLNTHYKKVAQISVSDHNFVGIKRQQADINALLQKNAAKLGGNAVIDIQNEYAKTVGTVIKFTT